MLGLGETPLGRWMAVHPGPAIASAGRSSRWAGAPNAAPLSLGVECFFDAAITQRLLAKDTAARRATAEPQLAQTQTPGPVSRVGKGPISTQCGVCFPPNVCVVVYCPLFGLYCVTPLLHFVCPCIVRVFHVFRRF